MSQESKFTKAEYFTNREVSWLGFNQRVLEEAQDRNNPLLERLKFLCIVTTNLDEFFEIRVAGIKQQIESEVTGEMGPDGFTPLRAFEVIRDKARKMVEDQYTLWREELVPALQEHGIRVYAFLDLPDEDKKWAREHFMHEVFPVLTPLAVDPSHPFPQLLNKSLNQIISFRKKGSDEPRYAVVQAPRSLNHLIPLPNRAAGKHEFILLSNLISSCADILFPGTEILGTHHFRITRNSDLYIDDEEASNLLATIEQELQNRNRGNAVRLEVKATCPPEIRSYLLEKCNLSQDDLYVVDGPIHLAVFMPMLAIDAPALKDKTYHSKVVAPLANGVDMFEAIRQQDILLHHPYEKFSTVTEFVQKSAADPKVLAIKMTLYRTSGDSPIVKALIEAAKNDKPVTVLVELKARFDEANNIAWARLMEEAGIHVVYGLVGLKTHCKVLMVVRRDDDQIRHYVHLGTGNYHPKTARLYTDLGLFTCNKKVTNEVATLFNTLTGMSDFRGFEKLMVAPFELANRILRLIHAETENARKGLPARIFAKMNALVDRETIEALYEASAAGVKIDLVIRGICCLRPGIPGVSENIRVVSIVGRYLEHSRIFYFENNGHPRIYLGSADLMPRNLFRRVEVLFPVEDSVLKKRITECVISVYMKDNVKARVLASDGSHHRPELKDGELPVSSQQMFMELAHQENAPIPKVIVKTAPPKEIVSPEADAEPVTPAPKLVPVKPHRASKTSK